MRIFSKVATAVAATLVGSSAFALPPGTVYNFKLVVAGSSAFQSSFKSELATMCSDTLDSYNTQSGGPNLQAYSCTLNSAAGSGLNGLKAIVFYRAEGGSVRGTIPGLSIKRIDPTVAGCTGASPTYTCTVTGYSLATDNITSGAAVNDSVMLGVSDLEASQFVLENWVDSTDGSLKLGTNPPAPIGGNPAVGQAFAVYVNKSVTGGVAGTPISISKQSLTSIFSGLYSDWSQVPNAAGTGFLSAGPISVCLRDAGSGTQAAASLFFNNQHCSDVGYAFAGSPFARNASTGTELTCVGNNAGAIGFAAIQSSNPANTSIVNIDGVVPSRVNAANGTYAFWYEVTFNSTPTSLSGNANTLAQTLISRMQTAATVPASSANVFALPSFNTPVLPVDSAHPVSLGTRQGNSCLLPQGFN